MTPMNTFLRDCQKLQRMKEVLGERESRVHDVAYLVLEGLGITFVNIEQLRVDDGMVYIQYGWSSRGLRDSDDRTLPLSLFTAEDPKAAAVAYNVEQTKKAVTKRIEQIKSEIRRLQNEIEEGNDD